MSITSDTGRSVAAKGVGAAHFLLGLKGRVLPVDSGEIFLKDPPVLPERGRVARSAPSPALNGFLVGSGAAGGRALGALTGVPGLRMGTLPPLAAVSLAELVFAASRDVLVFAAVLVAALFAVRLDDALDNFFAGCILAF